MPADTVCHVLSPLVLLLLHHQDSVAGVGILPAVVIDSLDVRIKLPLQFQCQACSRE